MNLIKINFFNNNYYSRKYVLILLFNIIFILILISNATKNQKKIGVIGVRHDTNIGNNLIKFAISIKLNELGYIPYIVGTHSNNTDISFINKTTNLVIINNNFSEIKKEDYDILMVNSDQTWRKIDKHFYDYGFLKFAENWKIKKFVYGASIGFDTWQFTFKEDENIKKLIKNFTGISVREYYSIKLIEEHLNIKPNFVLDPTLLINKKYYLDLIQNYKGKKIMQKKYIFIYTIFGSEYIKNAIRNASYFYNFDSYYFQLNNNSSIIEFIYYLFKSNAVITDSFHGTIFSIIFNKPFITIYDKFNAKGRFTGLGKLFEVQDRLYENKQQIDIEQLIKPLKINYKLLNKLKIKSINFIKKNLKK